MQTIIVDDKSAVVSMLQRILKRVAPAGMHNGYTDAYAAMQDAAHTLIDAAFLDIEMPEIDGVTLAKNIAADAAAYEHHFHYRTYRIYAGSVCTLCQRLYYEACD